MNLTASVALALMRGRPSLIWDRLALDPEFRVTTGLDLRASPYAGWSRLSLGELLRAAEKAAGGGTVTVEDLSGKPVTLRVQDGLIVLARIDEGGTEEILAPPDLQFLSYDIGNRLEALSMVLTEYGATGPKGQRWRPILEHRPATPAEVETLYPEIRGSTLQWRKWIREKIDGLELFPSALVPDLPDYFFQLCGPLPGELGVDDWLSAPVGEHRQALVNADIVSGLAAVLPGAIRHDLGPASLVSHIDGDALWAAAGALPPLDDPFSLLGLLEIALERRQHDGFAGLADEIVGKLLEEPFRRTDGTDLSEIYPALVSLSLRGIRRVEGLVATPPAWQRLCAFTHAGQLLSVFHDLEFNPEQMVAWISRSRDQMDVLAEVLNCRTDPMWTADFLTGPRIRAEVLGRLHLLRGKEEKAGRAFPQRDRLELATDDLVGRGLFPYLPGPLEAHHRPKTYWPDRMLPAESADKLLSSFTDDPRPTCGWLLSFSSFYRIDECSLKAAAEAVPRMSLVADTVSEALSPLMFLALTASQQSSAPLSEAVARRCIAEGRSLKADDNGRERADLLLRVLIAASTAQEEGETWLSDRLASYATAIPAGPWLGDMVNTLNLLKRLLPAKHWRFGRADAVARASHW